MTEKRYGGPTAEDVLAEILESRGVAVNMDRLRDRVQADHEGRDARRANRVEDVRTLATAVHRAREVARAASIVAKIEPTPAAKAESLAAASRRSEATEALRAACLNDEQTIAAALYATRP